MSNIGSRVLACEVKEILSVSESVIESEGSNPCIGYPVLVGSTAAKWHVPSLREPIDSLDWDLVATPSQSISFINKVKPNTTLKM